MTDCKESSFKPGGRRAFIGGSDARIIMGDDERALVRLWHEKRGEIEPEDLSENLSSSGRQPRSSIGVGSSAIQIRS